MNHNNNHNVIDYSNVTLINTACEIISDNLGGMVAENYRVFYGSKSKGEIMNSVEELLTDLVGAENAKKQIKNKFNI